MDDGLLTLNGYPDHVPGRFEDNAFVLLNLISGEARYTRVEAWKPSNLREFEGSYGSAEADATFDVAGKTAN